MKILRTLIITLLLVAFACEIVKAQSQNQTQHPGQELVLVTFECQSCSERNKFSVSGPVEFTFKKVKFPLEQKLKPGKYEMTYWQKKVQQIHLPFSVSLNSKNVIVVKN